jgi:hypothetical protein
MPELEEKEERVIKPRLRKRKSKIKRSYQSVFGFRCFNTKGMKRKYDKFIVEYEAAYKVKKTHAAARAARVRRMRARGSQIGRPKGTPCQWKGKPRPKRPRFDIVKVDGRGYLFTEKMRKFADIYMETGNKIQAAKEAYDCGSNSMAYVLANRNLKHPQEHLQKSIDLATDTIVGLAKNGEKEEVRLRASQDILDRLGYKAPERLEIDDKRELSDIDREAMAKVQNILQGAVIESSKKVAKINEAVIVNK